MNVPAIVASLLIAVVAGCKCMSKSGSCDSCMSDPAMTPMVEKSDKSPTTATSMQYTCSMHPEVVTNQPGKCPKCGMDLVEKK